MLTSIDIRRFQHELKQETYAKEEKSYVFWKRCFDLLIAGLVTVFVLAWLIPILGLLISIESRGPIIFVQLRTGKNGRRFRCLKFRTMTYERNAAFKQVVQQDARVTRIGKYLRKSNIDEMPQFLNVLAGSMSIVGPRPHAIDHDAKYWHHLPNYPKRYSVRPGITGLAQVRGARGVTEEHNSKMYDRLRYDLFYIKKRTLWQYVKICWWTIEAMYKGDENAY